MSMMGFKETYLKVELCVELTHVVLIDLITHDNSAILANIGLRITIFDTN